VSFVGGLYLQTEYVFRLTRLRRVLALVCVCGHPQRGVTGKEH
jgi:hypothetical protein